MWSSVASHLQQGDPDLLLARAQLLGLPVAIVGESAGHVGVVRSLLGEAPPRPDPTGDLSGLIVVDLSALWAGPLCGDFLARAGATVVKVESTQRPDGARRGPSEFFDLLNGRKRSVVLDFQSRDGIRILHDLVRSADVVIEASRPRALTQFGLDGPDLVRSGGPQIWVSITGHGREGEAGNRVAFGDDAAAAGGLVVWRNNVPLFCADAIADPLTGLTAADACLRALAEGGRWLLSVSMSAMSSAFSGPTLPTPPDLAVAPPRARPVETPAPPSGADTARVLAELEIDP
jgi:crotonobetainyl-CoA:carnitine CoA-transferase CaiB-like acyl-CoA transferase